MLIFFAAAAGTGVVTSGLLRHDPDFIKNEGTKMHELLLRFDEDLARTCRGGGCRCGGTLHLGRYRLNPRGLPPGLGPEFVYRWSFCCARCRRRVTPPSLRFLGRKVYLASIVILIS